MDQTLSGNQLVRISGQILADGIPFSQSSDGRPSSEPIAVREFRRVETKAEVTFEEQLAIRDAIASVGSFSSNYDSKLESAPSPAKSHGFAGFDLRGMVGRMFRGNSVARSGSGEQGASALSGGGAPAIPDDVQSIDATRDEIISRNAKIRAEELYDSPFAGLSLWLQKKRHKDLRAQLCSVEWLMSDGAVEFEEKALLMKLRVEKLRELVANRKSFSKAYDANLVRGFVEWTIAKHTYCHMFPVSEFNDIILEARIRQLQFLQPCHLDLEDTWDEHFETVAMCAMRQMQYCHRAVDKLLCVDEASRSVCNMIGYVDSDGGATVFPGADEFFPPFLLLLIRTNPPHLTSTIDYCSQLLEGTWSDYPNLEILLSHLEACKQFVLTCSEKSFTGDAEELKMLLQRAQEENPLPFEGGAGDGIVVEESKSDPVDEIFRILRKTESKRPQRFSETLRIIDSAQMRMTKANMEKLDKLDAAVRKLGL